MSEKIKVSLGALTGALFIPLIVVITGIGGFGLGRLSQIIDLEVPIVIENRVFSGLSDTLEPSGEKISSIGASNGHGNYVASKSGTKYHFPWCSGALRIKDENKVLFATAYAARAAGYEPATNCKGLD